LPSFLLLIAVGIEGLGPVARGLTLVLVAAASFYALSGMYGVQQKEDWRGVANYLSHHVKRGELLVLMDEDCHVPLDYYYDGHGPRIEVSRFADDAALEGTVDEILSRGRGERVWLVVSHADGEELETRLNGLAQFQQVESPEFVGIELVTYEWVPNG
jgi:hypothetical protein